MIATHAFDTAARIRSYELVAQAFSLPESAPLRPDRAWMSVP
jgi:hypothetical protein